jgi:predicted dehydrogenase
MRVAFIGCGNIAVPYAKAFAQTPELELVGAYDVQDGRAAGIVAEFGGTAYASLDELLADERVEAVVNLTAAVVHADVTRAALSAGKHVHSEKPLAMHYADAAELVDLAQSRRLGLSASPATLLGEAQQTMWKLIREGAIGRARVAYAEANWGKVESWHPAPATLHAVGAMGDVGVYPIAILTAIFGPARSVTAYSTTVEPNRIDLAGAPFVLETPDFIVALLELESGLVARVTASFYVGPGYQRGLEVHGDEGMLYLPTWGEADAKLKRSRTDNADDYAEVELVREPYHGIDWARPLVDLAAAVADGRPPRASGEQAAHIVEILDAIARSSRDGGPVAVTSSFPQPEPLDWAR